MTNMSIKKTFLAFGIVFLLSAILAFAHEQDFNNTKQLVDSGIGCDKLTDSQLEEIGEYYMEKMHPGEAHGLMHRMMGLVEDSDAEIQFHISMAKQLYCGESGGMMGMMQMTNMMGQGMMTGNMMGNYGFWSIWNILYLVLIVGLIALVYLGIVKLWKDIKRRK